MTSRTRSAAIHVMKLTAAKRQLDAAIRMYLMEEDNLAIMTVAAAADTLIRDLNRHHGRKVYSNQLEVGIVALARGIARNDPEAKAILGNFTSPESIEFFKNLAQQVKILGTQKTIDELRSNFPTINLPLQIELQRYTRLHRIPNFLKHADRDPRSTIDEGEINVLELIVNALSGYSNITDPADASPEAIVLAASVNFLITDGAEPERAQFPQGSLTQAIEEIISGTPHMQRKRACLEIIRRLKLGGKEALD